MKKIVSIAIFCVATLAAAQSAPPSQSTAPAPSSVPPQTTAPAQASAPSQTAASLTGKWKVHATIAGNDSDSECNLTQTGTDLSGTCGSGDQPVIKITGKVDGNKVSWSYNGEYNGTALTVKYSGTLAGDKITGEATVDPFGVGGDFTATRAS